jgi:hypothetical protein
MNQLREEEEKESIYRFFLWTTSLLFHHAQMLTASTNHD